MDEILKKLKVFSAHVDNFQVGASCANLETTPESQIKRLHARIHVTNADILFLRTLIDIVKTGNIHKRKKDETSFHKYEVELAKLTSCIRHPQNLAEIPDEGRALDEVLQMKHEEVEQKTPAVRNHIQIQNIVPQCSASQLQLEAVQNEIHKKIRDIQLAEISFMEIKFKFVDNLLKQKKQLEAKKSAKDKEYDRKKEELKALADDVNKLKIIIQRLIGSNDIDLVKNKRLVNIIIKTGKPINILTYGTGI